MANARVRVTTLRGARGPGVELLEYLVEAQRREAESATALLEFTRDISQAQGITEVAERVVQASARMLGSPTASLWLLAAGVVAVSRFPVGLLYRAARLYYLDDATRVPDSEPPVIGTACPQRRA